MKGMTLSPEMIDAAVIQLSGLMESDDSIPQEVRDTGKAFVGALDKWSEKMKQEKKS